MTKQYKEELLRLKNMLFLDWYTFWLIIEKLADRVMMHRVLLFQEMNNDRFDKLVKEYKDFDTLPKLRAEVLFKAYLDQFRDVDFSVVDFLTDYEVQDSIIKLLEFEDEK